MIEAPKKWVDKHGWYARWRRSERDGMADLQDPVFAMNVIMELVERVERLEKDNG